MCARGIRRGFDMGPIFIRKDECSANEYKTVVLAGWAEHIRRYPVTKIKIRF